MSRRIGRYLWPAWAGVSMAAPAPGLTRPLKVERAHDEHLLAVPSDRQGELPQFGADGVFVRRIGVASDGLRLISDDGWAAAYREDEMGRPFIDVYRLEVVPGPEGVP